MDKKILTAARALARTHSYNDVKNVIRSMGALSATNATNAINESRDREYAVLVLGDNYKISSEFVYATCDVDGTIQVWRDRPRFDKNGFWKGRGSIEVLEGDMDWVPLIEEKLKIEIGFDEYPLDFINDHYDVVIKEVSKSIAKIKNGFEFEDLFPVDPDDAWELDDFEEVFYK